MAESAVFVEAIGDFVCVGECVRFEKVKKKAYVARIEEIRHFSDLTPALGSYWSRADARCRHAHFVRVRWFAVVGDDDGIVAATDTASHFGRADGHAYEPKELVLRDVEGWLPADNINAVVVVVHARDVQEGMWPILGMRDAFMLAYKEDKTLLDD